MQADTLRGGPRSPWRARCPGWSSVGTSEDPVTVRTCAHRRSKCLSQEPFTAAHLSAKFPCLLDSEPALDICLLCEERAPVRTQSDLGQVPALFRPVSPNRHCCRGLGARRSLFLQPSGPLRPPCRHPDRPWEVDPHWPHTLGETEGIPQTHALSSPERPQALRVCVTFSVSRGGELVRLLPGFGDLGAGRPVAVSSRIKETRNVAAKSSGELQAPETGVVWPMPGGLGESPSGESQMLDSKADFVPPGMEI